MDKLDMFKARSVKIDDFGWWYLERVSADAGTQFTSTNFQDEFQTRSVWIKLAALKHQEMIGQVEETQRTLLKIAHSLMVHAKVLEAYTNIALMYTSYYILPVLPIKDLINEDDNKTTPLNLRQLQKLQYHSYLFYFFHVLYKKLIHMLGQRH